MKDIKEKGKKRYPTEEERREILKGMDMAERLEYHKKTLLDFDF